MKKFKLDKKTKTFNREIPFVYYARWHNNGICDEEWGIIWDYTEDLARKKLDKIPELKGATTRIKRKAKLDISRVIE